MKLIFEKAKDPTFWLGGAVAVQSINWGSLAPVGSQAWWVAGATFIGGIVAALMKNKSGGNGN